MSLKTDVAKTEADAEVVEADVEQDVKDAEAEGKAAVMAVADVTEAEAERVVAEVRKALGLKVTNPASAVEPRPGVTPAETADQPKHYEPERSPANQVVSPADQPAEPARQDAEAKAKLKDATKNAGPDNSAVKAERNGEDPEKASVRHAEDSGLPSENDAATRKTPAKRK